jgi:hypothetical protein
MRNSNYFKLIPWAGALCFGFALLIYAINNQPTKTMTSLEVPDNRSCEQILLAYLGKNMIWKNLTQSEQAVIAAACHNAPNTWLSKFKEKRPGYSGFLIRGERHFCVIEVRGSNFPPRHFLETLQNAPEGLVLEKMEVGIIPED